MLFQGQRKECFRVSCILIDIIWRSFRSLCWRSTFIITIFTKDVFLEWVTVAKVNTAVFCYCFLRVLEVIPRFVFLVLCINYLFCWWEVSFRWALPWVMYIFADSVDTFREVPLICRSLVPSWWRKLVFWRWSDVATSFWRCRVGLFRSNLGIVAPEAISPFRLFLNLVYK